MVLKGVGLGEGGHLAMAITEDEFAKLRVLWRGKTCGDIVGNQKAVVINGSISLEAACEVRKRIGLVSWRGGGKLRVDEIIDLADSNFAGDFCMVVVVVCRCW